MDFLENDRQFVSKYLPSPDKYHGLFNQGATCYLNSVLQVLFMTEDFREAVGRHTRDNPDCIDRHLTTLFDNLKGQTASTCKITKRLGIERVYEQQDAAEYFEKILGLTSPEASKIFHGLLSHETKCSACHSETGTNGAFWHLPLALVDSCSEYYSVVNGIEEYFRASDFSGENQMYCDECDAKSDATIKCVIQHHPEVLMLLLKRFEFDYRYMTYIRNNCKVVVPCTVQIPENHTYELYAVVNHSGDLRSGHYTATIKSQDDEKWYKFNDATVTLLKYQPFQKDDFQKSSSAYLLFYRKKTVHAADTCTPDIREESTPEDFPPAINIYDQSQDERVREREEVEGAAEAGNDTAVAVSIDRNEETGMKDIASVGSRRDIYVEDQGSYARKSIPDNHQEGKEERNAQDAHAEKQRDQGKTMTDDGEDMRGNAEKKETLSRETQLEESVDEDNDTDVRPDDFKLEVSDRHAIHGHLHKRRRLMDEKTDKDGKTGDDEQPENKEKSENQNSEGLEDVGQNMYEDQERTQEVGQDYDHKPVGVDKQGDGDRMQIDVKEGKTGADEREGASCTISLTVYDLHSSHKFQDNGRVGESKQPKDDQGCEQGRSSRCEIHERPREDQRDVQEEEQKTGDDKYAEMRETSMTKPYLSEGVEDEDKRRLDDVRQDRPQQKPISVEKQANEQESNGEHLGNRADSSLRQAGSRSVTEARDVGSDEKMRQENSQMKARAGFETRSGVQRSSEATYMTIKPVEETSEQDTLLEGACNLNLSESPLQEPQKHRTKRFSKKTRGGTNFNLFKMKKKNSDTQEQAIEAGKKQNKKGKNKEKKTTGCCSLFCKRRKSAD